MKTLLGIALLACLFPSIAFAQSAPYSRVLFNPTAAEINAIGAKGVALDHLQETANGFIGEFSKEETEIILSHCKKASILVQDLTQNFLDNNIHKDIKRAGLTYPIPAGFRLGSMGGYLTLAQADSHINAMIKNYPGLIFKKDSIGTSVQGRTIYAFKVSDNPDLDENEAEVLYTALHHAREPISLMQMIYFLYYLLENYGKDPDITYIVNNSEMYFIPVVNPDGYYYNQLTNPAGGGYWRKNRKMNPDNSVGIDLNRNYGYEWGYNNTGSSPSGSSDTYRGPSPFSEPETQAVRNFCNQREFSVALNYHTFGNHLIYPWGKDIGATTTKDSSKYKAFASNLTVENFYHTGTCMEALYYTVNGCSDDWMYGEQSSKNKIFSFTPEVGLAFWPPIDSIHLYCDQSIRQNINLALLGIQMKNPVGIGGVERHGVNLYPNPSSGKIFIDASPGMDINVSIFDCMGRLVFSGKPPGTGVDVSFLNDGIYSCSITQEGEIVLNRKLVILK